MLIALLSAKGSPGVTTTSMALATAWPSRVILVEADPAGGDLLAGFLAGSLGAQIGITELGLAFLNGADLSTTMWGQMVDLGGMQRLLLPGLTDPVQSSVASQLWPALAAQLAALEQASPSYDVIVDCGRLVAPHVAWPILQAADIVLVTVAATLPSVSAAVPALRMLADSATMGGAGKLGLLVRDGGVYKPAEVAKRLAESVPAPLVAALPEDRHTAKVVAGGGELRPNAPLVKTGRDIHARLIQMVAAGRARLRTPEVSHEV